MKQIGRYEILSEVGRGAMGVVFKARDPVIGRLIALKTITASVAEEPELVERFRREAKAAGGFQHPNIVTIYEMGEAEGVPFIAMEYLEGDSLHALISRGARIPLAQKVGYLVQTCRALQYAHRRGVIHRDIKPANIMVTSEGVVKVVDFGIARLAETSKTQTGSLLGTLSYMSPQQIRGEPADARSDIWSVGVVLYEFLTGQRPFKGENHAALMLSILQHEPVPLHELVRDCPRQLDVISRRSLAKDEAVRYQSMEELLLELKSAWAALNLNKSTEASPVSAVTAEGEYEFQEVASRAKLNIAQPAEKSRLRNAYSKGLPPIAPTTVLKATSIAPVSTTTTIMVPPSSSPNPTNLTLDKARKRSWRRGITFAAIGLTILAGIALEANRVRRHSSGKAGPPVAAAESEPPPSAVAQAVPSGANAIEHQPAATQDSTPDAQFNAALQDFKQAVAAKDVASLKSRVSLEFRQIEQEGGPRAQDAALYVSATIPSVLRSITPWPSIGCGVDAPDSEADVESGTFVACGVLDPPKLRWVQFSWPEFPAQARQTGLSDGLAMLSLTVDQRGAVIKARSRVQSDPYGFAESAIHAALRWKTTVPHSDGKPVRTEFTVDVPFSQ